MVNRTTDQPITLILEVSYSEPYLPVSIIRPLVFVAQSNMRTLRKACRRCTKAKRKCVVQRPKCTRCAQKDLECIYDLEPLNAPGGQPEALTSMNFRLPNSGYPGHCIIKTLKSRNPEIDPALSIPGDEQSLEFIRLGYQSVPYFIRERQQSPFVHSGLQLNGNVCNHLDDVKKDKLSFEGFQSLLQIDIEAVPFQEALTALQALLVYLAAFLFSHSDFLRKGAEDALSTLSEWTQSLLESATNRTSCHVSTWQEWLLGESVRRTMVMSYALSMAQSSFRHGYCLNWLFLESLPFDSRPGLWVAESPQAWIAAAGVRAGAEVGEKLTSFHEFAEKHDESDHGFCGDIFMYLITIFHNGCRT